MSAFRLTQPRISERALQSQIVAGLRYLGYVVLEIGAYRRRSRCPQCGAWSFAAGGYGNSTGAPDLLVSHAEWPAGLWVGLELKAPGGKLRTTRGGAPGYSQAELAALGRNVVCRSLEDALAALQAKLVRP